VEEKKREYEITRSQVCVKGYYIEEQVKTYTAHPVPVPSVVVSRMESLASIESNSEPSDSVLRERFGDTAARILWLLSEMDLEGMEGPSLSRDGAPVEVDPLSEDTLSKVEGYSALIAALRLSDQYLACAAALPAVSILERLLMEYPLVRLSVGTFPSLRFNSSFELGVEAPPIEGRLSDAVRLLLCFVNPSISSTAA
jgi:hypothetical protein